MKKFLQEFKEFISKGNVMDLAVGVIIGGAFSSIVTSLTDNIIKPLINCIGGAEVQGKIHLVGENYIDYGAFISAVILPMTMRLRLSLQLITAWRSIRRDTAILFRFSHQTALPFICTIWQITASQTTIRI